MPLKGKKKRKYNKRYYSANKETISDKKKEAYQENLERSRNESAQCSRASYDKDAKKS